MKKYADISLVPCINIQAKELCCLLRIPSDKHSHFETY